MTALQIAALAGVLAMVAVVQVGAVREADASNLTTGDKAAGPQRKPA